MSVNPGPEKFITPRGVVVFRLKKNLGRGKVHVAGHYTARWVRNYKQHYFRLSSTKRAARKLADDIDRFLDVPTNTIEHAIERFNPNKWERMNPKLRAGTIGDVLKAHADAEKSLGLDHQTGLSYRNGMMVFVRQAIEHRRGRIPSNDTIKAMSLDLITLVTVSDFKVARVNTAGKNKSDIETKKRSANSVFRAVKSLFTKAARNHYAHIQLPEKFDDILETMNYERVEKKKYRLPPTAVIERVMNDAAQLRNGYVDAAGDDVAPDMNMYLTFLLAAHCGQRKKEIAHAMREWIEHTKPPRMWVRSTPDFLAKGKDEGFAEVEPWVIDELETFGGPALLLSGGAKERKVMVFSRLNRWLKSRGLGTKKGEKAVHGLRALFGSMIATTRGIFTAQKFLRHKTVDVTNDSYADVVLDESQHLYWTRRPKWAEPRIADGVEVANL